MEDQGAEAGELAAASRCEPRTSQERFRGLMLGTAVGDALGLPAEGISRRRSRKMFTGRWRHRFLPGLGMLSDDTEHTMFVAQSLLTEAKDATRFAHCLARHLRYWFLSLPAGIGLATLRSILRLWSGVPPSSSGVFSAGNGPSMRAAAIGAFFADSATKREQYLRASTVLTHTDPKAYTGAKAVADLAAWSMRRTGEPARPDRQYFLELLLAAGTDDDAEWQSIVQRMDNALETGCSVEEYADSLGLQKGVTGYIYHSVPVAVFAWYVHFGDFEATVAKLLSLGGDTDSTAAVGGALAGAVVGDSGIPADWRKGIFDWPRGKRVLLALADELEKGSRPGELGEPVRYFWPGVMLRNLFFLVLVLLHGFRRLLPPY